MRAFYAKLNTADDPAPDHRGIVSDFARVDNSRSNATMSPIPVGVVFDLLRMHINTVDISGRSTRAMQ